MKGKTCPYQFLDLYPLSYFEFLMAMSKGQHVELLKIGDFDMAAAFKQDYVDLLKYYYVGGMPEVVRAFADSRDFNEVREIQQRILAAYEQDFSKHALNEAVSRIRMLWLTDCGLVHKVHRVTAPRLPLKAYEELRASCV